MADNEVTGWVGWGWFAGIVLLIAGVFSGLHGFTRVLAPSSAYFLVVEGGLVVLDVQGWGWWHLIIGHRPDPRRPARSSRARPGRGSWR